MKYLDFPLLTYLSDSLSDAPSPQPELRVRVRFEAYSVKPVGKERKMFKEMEEAYLSGQEEMEEMSFSPEMKEAGLSSCFGRLDEKESRKVHFLLVTTLNAAFPENDFSALRPDHFTREPSALQVLAQLSKNFFGPTSMAPPQLPVGSLGVSPSNAPVPGLSSSLGNTPSSPFSSSSPSNLPVIGGRPDIVRALNEVVPLDECEVYSWFPEPEYDPHAQSDEGEGSEDDFGIEEELEDVDDQRNDMDIDMEPSWGQAGMELDDVPPSAPPGAGKRRSVDGPSMTSPMYNPDSVAQEEEWDAGRDRRMGGLLWSSNYFFYSKRQKRVLFATCWCRKRPAVPSSPADRTSFPLPLSSSFHGTTTTSSNEVALASVRNARALKSMTRTNGRMIHKRSKPNLKAGDPSSTIPIRGMETPRSHHRLASSAPSISTFSNLHGREPTPSPAGAMAKMTAGGFRPRQPRTLINAARAAQEAEKALKEEQKRTRSERSDSTTPVPTSGLGRLVGRLVTPPSKKGRVHA